MEILRNRHVKEPFIVLGLQCIVVPVTPHVIRIFYAEHVYDVQFTHEELRKWVSSGTQWQREYIRKLIANGMCDTPADERNASIEDGYIA